VSDSKKFALKNENGSKAFRNHKNFGPSFGGADGVGADFRLMQDFTS